MVSEDGADGNIKSEFLNFMT